MQRIKKVLTVLVRKLICLLDGINNRVFTNLYWRYLDKLGITFSGRPNYICSSAYFDGQGMSLISIGKDAVISREVMFLTHDYSIETALHSVGLGTVERSIKIDGSISVGDNSFIGARVSLLPGSTIGNNCIIGACAVVKGHIPDNSVAVGNPARVIKTIDMCAEEFLKSHSLDSI